MEEMKMKRNEEKVEIKEEEIFGITEEELEESKEEDDENVSGQSE